MPKRDESQQIGSLAEASVREVWNSIGAAVDSIQEDYGEDLLVQPCFNGDMDKSRLWVQVKGTEQTLKRRSDGTLTPPTVYIKRDLIARWIGTADLVVLIRWHVSHKIGWYRIIQHEFDEEDLREKDPSKKIRIKFLPEDRFDEEAARAIAWVARISSASKRISMLRANQEIYGHEYEKEDHERVNMKVLSVTMDIMVTLGLLDGSPEGGVRVSQKFRHTLAETIFEIFERKKSKRAIKKSEWEPMLFVAHLKFIGDKFSSHPMLNYVPGELALEMTDVARGLLNIEGVIPGGAHKR